jgi:hypothetical protein
MANATVPALSGLLGYCVLEETERWEWKGLGNSETEKSFVRKSQLSIGSYVNYELHTYTGGNGTGKLLYSS